MCGSVKEPVLLVPVVGLSRLAGCWLIWGFRMGIMDSPSENSHSPSHVAACCLLPGFYVFRRRKKKRRARRSEIEEGARLRSLGAAARARVKRKNAIYIKMQCAMLPIGSWQSIGEIIIYKANK